MRQHSYYGPVTLIGQKRIPKAKPSTVSKAVNQANAKIRHMVHTRPTLTGPASWLSDFISLRKNVRLCLECHMKWAGWHKSAGYRSVGRAIGDCQACRKDMVEVFRWLPEERAFK